MAALFAVSAVASARAEDVRAEPPRQEPPSAVGGCAVTADDGHKFMDSRVASCRDYYYPAHACSTDAGQATPICQRMNTMMGVDLARPDMIIAPHRGVFGMSLPSSSGPPTNPAIALGGPPENSWPGVGEAQGAGFRFIEYDMLLMGDAADPSQPQEVMMTHYTDLRAFTDYAGPQTTPNTGIAPCAGWGPPSSITSDGPTTAPSSRATPSVFRARPRPGWASTASTGPTTRRRATSSPGPI